MYPSRAGYLLSLSSIALIVRAARWIGVSITTGAGCCCAEADRNRPGLAGVLMKAPGVGRWGVAGGILCAMEGDGGALDAVAAAW